MLTKATKTIILTLLFCVMQGCAAPNAVKTDIQGIRNNVQALERLIDQKANNTAVAEQIDQVNNKIKQITQLAENLSVWRKNVEAETINYGGAGWVIIGTCAMASIFVGAGLLLIRAFMRRGNLLTLLTCAVQKIGKHSPEAVQAIKEQLKIEVSNGDSFTERDRKNLGSFAKKRGTFAK